jgi:hypothetical protein
MEKAKRAFQRSRARNVRDGQQERDGTRSPSLEEKYSAPSRQNRLAQDDLTVAGKASPAKPRRLLMCWQLLACIPGALVVGDNIRPQDMCWANVEWARAHRCGLVACMRTWHLRSRLLVQGVPCALCSQPDKAVWCQITRKSSWGLRDPSRHPEAPPARH